jgi:DNA-directed RNA polymerase
MPNLIHSLYASVIALLINYIKINNNSINIYTIHDCFAISVDNVDNINERRK